MQLSRLGVQIMRRPTLIYCCLPTEDFSHCTASLASMQTYYIYILQVSPNYKYSLMGLNEGTVPSSASRYFIKCMQEVHLNRLLFFVE